MPEIRYITPQKKNSKYDKRYVGSDYIVWDKLFHIVTFFMKIYRVNNSRSLIALSVPCTASFCSSAVHGFGSELNPHDIPGICLSIFSSSFFDTPDLSKIVELLELQFPSAGIVGNILYLILGFSPKDSAVSITLSSNCFCVIPSGGAIVKAAFKCSVSVPLITFLS